VEDAHVTESCQHRRGCLAGASVCLMTEVHGDTLSLLSQHGQPLVIAYKHSVKQVTPVSLSSRCHVQAAYVHMLSVSSVFAESMFASLAVQACNGGDAVCASVL